MKRPRFNKLLVATVALSATLAGIITMAVWDVCVEDKVFHCWDIGWGSFWTSIELHESAGDAISADWTWEQLKTVRVHYIEAFWLLSGVIVFVLFWIFDKARGLQGRKSGY